MFCVDLCNCKCVASWFTVGTTMPINLLDEEQVKEYHEDERQQLQKTLDKYIRACERAGVLSSFEIFSKNFIVFFSYYVTLL